MSDEQNATPEETQVTPESAGNEAPFSNRVDLTGIREMVDNVRAEIRKVIVGQDEMIDLLICGLLANGHVLVEGVPGVAKTLTVRILAKTLDTGFSRIQFTPDLMPSDIIGTTVFNTKTSEFEFKKGPVFSNIVLIDEINRSPAKTQAALFEVMQEQQITIDGTTYPMDSPFMVIATQNPIEHEGTYRLPEAQLDRFLFKIEVGYPSMEHEVAILEGSFNRKSAPDTQSILPVISSEELNKLRAVVNNIHVEKELMGYIAGIVQETRNSSAIYIGASPRASVYMMKAAQAWAAMRGRDFISPEDVKQIIVPTLRHRIMLTPEKEMEGVKPDTILQQLANNIEVPR